MFNSAESLFSSFFENSSHKLTRRVAIGQIVKGLAMTVPVAAVLARGAAVAYAESAVPGTDFDYYKKFVEHRFERVPRGLWSDESLKQWGPMNEARAEQLGLNTFDAALGRLDQIVLNLTGKPGQSLGYYLKQKNGIIRENGMVPVWMGGCDKIAAAALQRPEPLLSSAREIAGVSVTHADLILWLAEMHGGDAVKPISPAVAEANLRNYRIPFMANMHPSEVWMRIGYGNMQFTDFGAPHKSYSDAQIVKAFYPMFEYGGRVPPDPESIKRDWRKNYFILDNAEKIQALIYPNLAGDPPMNRLVGVNNWNFR